MTFHNSTTFAGATFGVMMLGALSLGVHPVAAKECEKDAAGGCARAGLACSPPTGGKCVQVTAAFPAKYDCECQAGKKPAAKPKAAPKPKPKSE